MQTPSVLRVRQEAGGTPPTPPWGVDSEYGVLRQVLLGPPDHLRLLPTSSFSKKSLRRGLVFDRAVAVAQHAELVAAFREAGAVVHMLQPDPALPYQVFARDSSVMTPFGAIVTQMSQWWRRGEYAAVIDFYLQAGIPIYDSVTAGSFEGGDFMVIEPGRVLCGYTDERTQEVAARQVKAWLEQEGYEVKLAHNDPYFLHMDTMVVMLARKLAAVCRDCTNPEVLDWLAANGIETLDIAFPDMLRLGCNVVALGDDRVLLPAANTVLRQKCRAVGLRVYDPDISMISMCGGGVHCLCQPLQRDPG
jgi:N-dimethylarginine dimethylaminohydrolase